MSHLYFVTSNTGKSKEAEKILEFPIQVTDLELNEIQSLDLSEIVAKKAQEAFQKIKKPLIVDDIGIFIDTWNGFPGPFIKYILNTGGTKLLLKMLKNEKNRNVIVKAAIGFHNGSKVFTFIGEKKGHIALSEKGTNGFGFDPIFIPDYSNKTYAELSEKEKNKISHRFLALQKFKKYLKEENITFN